MDATQAKVGGKEAVVDAYRKALATAAAFAVMGRALIPEELRFLARWAASALRARLGWWLVVRRSQEEGGSGAGGDGEDNDPRAIRRLGVTLARTSTNEDDAGFWRSLLFLEPGDSTVDTFEGVEFTWTCGGGREEPGPGVLIRRLELSFDAENEGRRWHKVVIPHHPATFDTLAMDPALKRSIVADLDVFAGRDRRRTGKAWKPRGYLIYGPPGTGKSSLVGAMANRLRYDLYDLDLSQVQCSATLKHLLAGMPTRSILVVEDIVGCYCSSREDAHKAAPPRAGDDKGTCDDGIVVRNGTASAEYSNNNNNQSSTPGVQVTTLSWLLNLIDDGELWPTSCEERIIVLTTSHGKGLLYPALLHPGRMDMKHVYMGYCGWEAFKTLAKNYFDLDDHGLFPEIQGLLAEVEVTPAAVSEMLMRSDDADVALQDLKELLLTEGKKTIGD
ncbi:hypothetical protein U9M48_007783 [Paspalum notatum var. saurae]|uniref:AAA+ ATPase domain-containing protein n=1 Tax=Paspalum notatum var. saurae TaxID=547442 RepID=A0AAQ3SN61_PASNO